MASGFTVIAPVRGWPRAYNVTPVKPNPEQRTKYYSVAVGLKGAPLAADLAPGTLLPPELSLALTLNLVPGFGRASALQEVAARALFFSKGRRPADTTVITGRPGTGKSWTQKIACEMAEARGMNFICIAQNAIVARSMPRGQFQRRPIPPITVEMFILAENDYIFPAGPGGASKKPASKRLLIFIDEYSMVTAAQLDSVLAKARKKFGLKNVQLALFGDHHQLPPVSGNSPWLSSHLRKAIESESEQALAVYELRQQQRFANDETEELVDALVSKKLSIADELLRRAATKTRFPKPGTCTYIAFTNAQLQKWNDAAYKIAAAEPNANETIFRAAKGDPAPPSFHLVNGMEVTYKKNNYTKDAVRGIEYTDYNGLNGTVHGLQGGTTVIHDTTVIKIRLANGDTHMISPKLMTLNDVWKSLGRRPPHELESEGPPLKRKRGAAGSTKVWWFHLHQGPAKTMHIVQGATLKKGTKVVVDLSRLPSTAEGYNMLYVAASRVQQFADMYIVGFEQLRLRELANACPCGCHGVSAKRKRKITSIGHNDAKLQCHLAWLDALLARRRAVFI